jgi:SAM-dependent methyltransferase
MDRDNTLQQLDCEGRQRLNPSITDPNWLILRRRRAIFTQWINDLPSSGLTILDVGGRLQPYRPLLGTRASRYISVDLRPTPLVSIIANGEALPLRESSFDLVLCTQVLQYASDPAMLLQEVHRVLRPGGRLFLSVPSAQIVDSAEECWRFLPHALRQMLRAFDHVEIVPEGGSVAGFFRTMNCCFNIFVRYSALRVIYQHTISPLLNVTGAALDHVAGSNQQFTSNYSVLAQK